MLPVANNIWYEVGIDNIIGNECKHLRDYTRDYTLIDLINLKQIMIKRIDSPTTNLDLIGVIIVHNRAESTQAHREYDIMRYLFVANHTIFFCIFKHDCVIQQYHTLIDFNKYNNKVVVRLHNLDFVISIPATLDCAAH